MAAVPVGFECLHERALHVYCAHVQFHMELELLSAADKAAPTIAFPLKLESYLMEGNYNKVRLCSYRVVVQIV
jgi:hypothetical protein